MIDDFIFFDFLFAFLVWIWFNCFNLNDATTKGQTMIFRNPPTIRSFRQYRYVVGTTEACKRYTTRPNAENYKENEKS